MPEFSWVPIYREIAKRLLDYQNRQQELIAVLRDIHDRGLPMFKLDDEPAKGQRAPLTEIDPFTFMASFNRGRITDDKRKAIVAVVQESFGLRPSPPADFSGIPVVFALKSRFFPYKRDGRDPADIPSLWRIASHALNAGPDALDPDLFERCRSIKDVGVGKLTMGLFWLSPDSYLSLDAVMREHLQWMGLEVPAVASLAQYKDLVTTVRARGWNDFKMLSHEAWRRVHPPDGPSFPPANDMEEIEALLRQQGQIVLCGPPGTGKTYTAQRLAKKLILGNAEKSDDEFERHRLGKRDREHTAGGEWEIVQFHPSYSYEDFVRGIQAKTVGQDGTYHISYEVGDRVFGEMCQGARASKEPYVLIIDEINRANLASVLVSLSTP